MNNNTVFMNLKEKLRQIDSSLISHQKSSAPSGGRDIEYYVDGIIRETPYGSCFVSTNRYKKSYDNNTHTYFKLLEITPRLIALAGKDFKLEEMEIHRALFVDTETTGLAGGSGTYAFLIGLGFFENDEFIVEQYFMRDYSEEQAILHCLKERLETAGSLITYNGKCYDIPLLKTRFALSRFSAAVFPDLHLDLLFTVRRLWKTRLSDCSLSSVEKFILGVNRTNDVFSYLIPHLFFEYVRSRNASAMKPIFNHNVQDILSLAIIAVRASEMFDVDSSSSLSHGEYMSIGKVYEELGKHKKSTIAYNLARNSTEDRALWVQAAEKLGMCYKRQNNWKNATSLWENMITRGFSSLHPYVELAKYYEHISHDFDKAQEYVQKALHAIDVKEMLHSSAYSKEDRAALLHRQRRLKNKIAKNR